MTQFARPASTTENTGWTAVGAATPHEAVNEAVESDAEYAQADGCELLRGKFSVGIIDPNIHTDHVFSYRVRGETIARLFEGTRLVAEYEQDDAVITRHDHPLSVLDAGLITDYNDLYWEIEVVAHDDLPMLLHAARGGNLYGNPL